MDEQLLHHKFTDNQHDAETIKNWIINYMAELLEIERESIDADTDFDRYGLDSSTLVILSGDLQTWLGRNIEPTILYDYMTINALSTYLANNSTIET